MRYIAETYSPKVHLADGAVAPDSWSDEDGLVPPAGFAVSRFRDGSVASIYEHLSWNLTPYHPTDKTLWLHFAYWGNTEPSARQLLLLDEMHFLVFLLLWKRKGNPLSPTTISNYLAAIRQIAAFCEVQGCTLREFLGCINLLICYVQQGIRGSQLTALKNLLGILIKIGPARIGFSVLGASANKVLKPHLKAYTSGARQYAPVPTRIYSEIISSISQLLSEWEEVESRYLALVNECAKDSLLGKRYTEQIRIAKEKGIERLPGVYKQEFPELVAQYGLCDYFNKNNLPYRVQGLTSGLNNVLTLVKLSIVLFSGMRNQEATYLPYSCLGTDSGVGGKRYYLIFGMTTKLSHRQSKWVTNAEAHRAIKIAQRIADVVYGFLDEAPSDNRERVNKYPLFISPAYLGIGTAARMRNKNQSFQPVTFRFAQGFFKAFGQTPMPIIQDVDLLELEHIDPHRAWESEAEFQLGKPWRLTEHQLRRSLALYAQRSGLVSLPSLRRQLQHLTEGMARYYAHNSIYAKNFIGDDKNHFGWEWQATSPESAGLAFIRDVLFSREPIFGGYANWLEHRLGTPDGQILLDRDNTMRLFKKGEMDYKETPMGGCTKVGPCDEVALRFLDVDCLGGCSNLVGRLSKLEQVIKGQTSLVNRLKLDSIEWKIEKADLDVLLEMHTRVLHQRGEIQ